MVKLRGLEPERNKKQRRFSRPPKIIINIIGRFKSLSQQQRLIDVLRDLYQNVTDERFRIAIVLGIVSVPFTVGFYWILTPDGGEATFLLIACIVSGYLYGPRSVSAARAGTFTGFVGGVPIVVWRSWTVLVDWWRNPIIIGAVGDSVMMAAVSVGAALLTVVVMPVILMLVGWVGGTAGGWINERVYSTRLLGSKT